MFTLYSMLLTLGVMAINSAIVLAAPQGVGSTAEEFQTKLGYQHGKVNLQNGLATLNLLSSDTPGTWPPWESHGR